HPATTDDLRTADYWTDQVRHAVRYADAITTLESEGVTTLLEIGPGGVLTALATQSVRDPDAVVATAALRNGRPEPEALVGALGVLYARGVDPDWEAFFAGSGARRVPLPTYAFQHQRYWLDPMTPPAGEGGPAAPVRNTASREDARDGSEAEGREAEETVSLTDRLAGLTPVQQEQHLLGIVTTLVAAILRHTGPEDIAPDRPFQDLGFDSLTGVELRNRLGAATGLRLPATVVFDHPSPAALTAFLRAEAAPRPADPSRAVLDELDRLEASLAALPDGDDSRDAVSARLRALLAELTGPGRATDRADTTGSGEPAEETADVAELIASASADEIFDFIDTQLGRVAD
ncbi:phosphopantetheine-binding protein, partial [Streptomyces sp. NPDC006368]|uniref:phosphopantetheine-binding protein n=1 Tax=Streptomyces sp. NPDC006368 TaxID=3156760 RepID=UPI0033B7584D